MIDVLWQSTAVASLVAFTAGGFWLRRQVARLDAWREGRGR